MVLSWRGWAGKWPVTRDEHFEDSMSSGSWRYHMSKVPHDRILDKPRFIIEGCGWGLACATNAELGAGHPRCTSGSEDLAI